MPGHESAVSTAPFTHVEDLLAVLDQEQAGRAWLVGASAGGGLALDAALAPDRVAGLVLLGTAVSGAPEPELDPDTQRFDVLLDAAIAAGNLDEVNRLETWLWLDGPSSPGYGGSPAPAGTTSLADYAHRCGELLHELGVERAHWVGHSSSCCIGLQLALDDPRLVASLILFEPAKPSGAVRDAHASSYAGAALKAAAHGDIPTAFDVFLRGVGGDGYRQALRRQIGEDGLAAAAGESAYFFAHEMPALAAWSFGPAEADAVTAPALVVTGAGTRPWFHENATILAAMLPHAEALTLPGLNHLAPLTDPATLAPAIADYVRRVPARS